MKNLSILVLIFLFLTRDIFASIEVKSNTVKNGIGLGSVIAIVISWDRNKSVLLAIVHGILSWFYVIYYLLALKDK